MGRPRLHDLETLLDHARALWVEAGTTGVTIRALSARSGVSNGAIYNAFGSRENLLARTWSREARMFLAFQRDAVEASTAGGDAADGVLAAALAYADYATDREEAARLLTTVAVGAVMAYDVGDDARAELDELRRQLGVLVVELSLALWGRRDVRATALVTMCVVDLPGALLLSHGRITDPLARHALTNAVRGITNATPPPPRPKDRT